MAGGSAAPDPPTLFLTFGTFTAERAEAASTAFRQAVAETYTFFKAPYYRVHVGDFHDRTRAYSTSQIIKRQFPSS